MAKTRRSAAKLLGARPVLGIVAGLAFVGMASLGYLWQVKQIHSLGKQQKMAEIRLEELKRLNERLQRAYSEMCAPTQLDARVKQMKLGLVAPQPDQIVRLSEGHQQIPRMESRRYLAGQLNNDVQ